MNVHTKYELAPGKRKTSLLMPGGYFIVKVCKKGNNF